MNRSLWLKKIAVRLWPLRFFFAKLTRLPLVGWLFHKIFMRDDYLAYMPDEQVVTKKEKVVLPDVVVDHFIEKAAGLFIMDKCLCREGGKCEQYPVSLGCLFIGEAARDINPALGREVSVEEAKAFQRRVAAAGLINLVGKTRLDQIWLGVKPPERLLTVCHCCECCCLWTILPAASASITQILHKMDGVEIKAHPDNCRGCGNCQDVCFARAIHITDKRAVIDDSCRGCGRCVRECPHDALELVFAEGDVYAKCLTLIENVEQHVNVE